MIKTPNIIKTKISLGGKIHNKLKFNQKFQVLFSFNLFSFQSDTQFAKINKNFARVYQSEQTVKRILSEATHQFKALTDQEKILDMKGLSLKFLIQKENKKISFILA